MGFTIVTWNINGLRSFGNGSGWRKIFTDFDADLICFQETKVGRSAVEEWMAFVPDYSSYFTFPRGDRGSLQDSGYSGVATFCRESSNSRPSGSEMSLFDNSSEVFSKTNKKFEFDKLDEEHCFATRWPSVYKRQNEIGLPPSSLGCNMWKLVDAEGRCVVTKHSFTVDNNDDLIKNLFVFNVYCPRNDPSKPDRRHFQLRFYHMLQKRALQLLNESSDNFVIILGDYNTTHGPNDVYDDDQWGYAGSYSRQWFVDLLSMKPPSSDTPYFYDAFRHLNSDARNSFTCWNTQLGCRATNYGSRLDYIVIDHKLLPYLLKCYPLTDYKGSDHCPVVAQFDDRICFTKQNTFSTHCTKMWPEFGSGASQVSIKNFFQVGDRSQVIAKMQESPTKRALPSSPAKTPPPKRARKNSKVQPQSNSVKNYFQSFKLKVTESGPLQAVICEESKEPESSKIEPVQPEPESCESILLDQNYNSQSSDSETTKSVSQKTQAEQWKNLFRPEPVPLCRHKLPCIKQKVKKPGPKQGCELYACPKKSVGPPEHPESRCKYFRWVSFMKKYMSPQKKQPQPNGEDSAQDDQNEENRADSQFSDEMSQEDIDNLLDDIN